ncbi:hypothetical protein HOP50_05g39260 [Chloropicon primus]|uniref:Uncharacterized protein n=2 Tax=Chloropicon primus TaxID=1764295 RepID=A0A5B8MLS3_9CHLO|nr:hypothetical protein A3770_05p39150 [Chloropicon primus]UPR00611.1 hypothetical protein HOP50_05g39260 [Chloropicon primus]|eukprot:QDZ21397.1 hypothetical protein A3770_05p39150 [Chloropicon primus]
MEASLGRSTVGVGRRSVCREGRSGTASCSVSCRGLGLGLRKRQAPRPRQSSPSKHKVHLLFNRFVDSVPGGVESPGVLPLTGLFAADEPRAVPRTDQKKELAKKALEQAFQGKESIFAKLDDGSGDGGGNGSGDQGGGGGGGGGGNDGGWGEVFNMAVKIAIYLFLGVVFLVVWPKFFTGVSNVYSRATNQEVQADSKPVKEDFDDEDFEALENEGDAAAAGSQTVTGMASTPAAGTQAEAATKPAKRVFPEREAFDTWQFGGKKGDLQDELQEREIQMVAVEEQMLDREGKFRDEFQAKPRSKHVVLKDTIPKEKPGPYQEYVSKKWK